MGIDVFDTAVAILGEKLECSLQDRDLLLRRRYRLVNHPTCNDEPHIMPPHLGFVSRTCGRPARVRTAKMLTRLYGEEGAVLDKRIVLASSEANTTCRSWG